MLDKCLHKQALELTHFLVYPRNSGGFSIQDCDDTNTYANLNELITKSPVVKGCFPIPSPKPVQIQQVEFSQNWNDSEACY